LGLGYEDVVHSVDQDLAIEGVIYGLCRIAEVAAS
jgi:hypothetical protein